MKKLREICGTLAAAVRYSFAFCVRNARNESYARLILAFLTAVVLYSGVKTTGMLVNEMQNVSHSGVTIKSIGEFVDSSIFLPAAGFILSLVLGVIVGRYSWLCRNRWSHILRHANHRELNEHRASLDFARFRSKEYDDLAKRIQELPASWGTRIWFAEEMLNFFSLTVSFFIFGSQLLVQWPIYAAILGLTSIPMIIGKSKIIGQWWTLFQEHVPHHKQRSILERPFHNPVLFAQAIIFNQMRSLRLLIDANVDKVIDDYDVIRRRTMRVEMLTNLISVAGLCAVLTHAFWKTASLGTGLGTLMVLIASAKAFQSSLEGIAGLVVDQWNNVKGILLLERDFFGLRPQLVTSDPVVPHFNGPPRLRVESINFTYPDKDTLVLRNVSFVVEPCEKVCILGKSGSGKTSLAAILARFYDPIAGNIYFGDLNLQNILPKNIAGHISVLGQDYSILDRTISEEIASSRMDEPIDQEKVETAARFAHFDPVVNADSQGYGAQIGTEQGGREFSGGEKQRLALARVRYRDASILIFDEPDAKLDAESAQKVMDNIFALTGKSVILITHQISRAERCDKVIILDQGQIVEQGAPSVLMAKGGAYTRMFQMDSQRRRGVE